MNRSPDVVYIYVLCESDTGRVRYVGSTVDPGSRLKMHAGAWASMQVSAWVSELSERGAAPVMRVIDTAAPDRRDVIERRWIRRVGQRATLINTQWVKGGPPSVMQANRAGRQSAASSVRLYSDTRASIRRIAARLGVSQAAVIAMAVSLLGEAIDRAGEIPPPTPPPATGAAEETERSEP